MSVGARAGVVAAGTAVATGVGWLAWDMTRPVPVAAPAAVAPEAAPEAAAAPEVVETAPEVAAAPEAAAPAPEAEAAEPEVAAAPEPEVAAAPDPAPEPAPAPAAEPAAPVPPVIGTWLVAADGSATIAGRAEPGARVRVLVDGKAVAETVATAAGEFALVTTLAANPAPSLMTLVMVLADGTEVPSAQTVALGPIAGPAEVEVAAVAEPAAPETAATETAAPETEPAAEPAPAAPAPAEPAAPEPPPALMLTDEGATLLQEPAAAEPAAPGGQVAVTVETIAYAEDGTVRLGGSGEPGAVLRIYLDNAPVAELAVPAGGKWLATLTDTAPGIYTLRVDQLNAEGAVTARFETPFKRETPEALAAAAAPAEAAPAEAAPEPPAAAPATPEAPAEVAAATVAPAEGTVAPEAPAADTATAAVAPEAAPAAPAPEPVAPAAAEAAAAEPAAPEPAPAAPEPAPPAPRVTVTVQPGHTLWAIARGEMGEGMMYVQVWEANKDSIRDPDLIYPGQVFTIPVAE